MNNPLDDDVLLKWIAAALSAIGLALAAWWKSRFKWREDSRIDESHEAEHDARISTINHLREENDRLSEALEQCRNLTDAEREKRILAETDLAKLKIELHICKFELERHRPKS